MGDLGQCLAHRPEFRSLILQVVLPSQVASPLGLDAGHHPVNQVNVRLCLISRAERIHEILVLYILVTLLVHVNEGLGSEVSHIKLHQG